MSDNKAENDHGKWWIGNDDRDPLTAEKAGTSECHPKTGWLSGDTYCAVHGRSAGWPCSVSSTPGVTGGEQ